MYTVRKTSRNASPPPVGSAASEPFEATVPFNGRVAMAVGKTGSPAKRIFLVRQEAKTRPRQNARRTAMGDGMPANTAGSFLPRTTILPRRIQRGPRHLHQFMLGMVCADSLSVRPGGSPTMSLFGAINTAISGLTAQSSSFGNISEDVANSQTVGFKRVDTNFINYLTTSTPAQNEPGAVVATPDYVNNVQGTITQSDNPLALAITGQGFFAVSQATGQTNGVPTFNPQQFYSRAGDFTMNSQGYLVNSAGDYLNGWSINPATGAVDQNALNPIQISQT
jgi:hypothetical protein